MGSLITVSDLEVREGVARVEDLRLAEALGFADRHMIRALIKRHIAALQQFGEVSVMQRKPSARGGRPSTVYFLNEEQAIYITAKSDTPRAAEITVQMVRVFRDYLKGEAKPVKVRARRRALPAPAASEVVVRLAAMEQQMRMLTASPFSRFTGQDAEVWVEPVRGDRMSPTLRHMQDFVIVRRAHGYEGEGVYLFRHDVGGPCIGRVGSALNGKRELMLYGDNKHYGESAVPQDWFNERVIGIVIADVKVRQTRELSPLAHCA